MKMYIEFKDQEYYALITVNAGDELEAMNKATDIYLDIVAGETRQEIIGEGLPHITERRLAFSKWTNTLDNRCRAPEVVLHDFDNFQNEVLLVDCALV